MHKLSFCCFCGHKMKRNIVFYDPVSLTCMSMNMTLDPHVSELSFLPRLDLCELYDFPALAYLPPPPHHHHHHLLQYHLRPGFYDLYSYSYLHLHLRAINHSSIIHSSSFRKTLFRLSLISSHYYYHFTQANIQSQNQTFNLTCQSSLGEEKTHQTEGKPGT